MQTSISIYCDESCHLENRPDDVMVLGCVWCPTEKAAQINRRLREIVAGHGLARDFEFKWTKVSPAGLALYMRLVDYFFDDDDLHFRAVVIPDKARLNHAAFHQTHDDWYYKMYFRLLEAVLDPSAETRIFLDYKDTQGSRKVARLGEFLRNSIYDFSASLVRIVQVVHSREVPLVQLTDLLIGAVGYANRGLTTSAAKKALVERMRERSGYSMEKTTLLREAKLNILRWRATEAAP